MNFKKSIIVTAAVSFGLAVSIIPTSLVLSHAGSTPKSLTNEIVASKPGKGEEITVLPESLARFWQMDNLLDTYKDKATEIGDLTPYNLEMANWVNHIDDKTYLLSLFNKYDSFKPTNNVLSWTSKLNAKSYRVIISQDSKLSTIEREYVVDGSENKVTFVNPYSGVKYYWQVIATMNDNSLVYSDIFNFETSKLPRTLYLPGVSNTRDLGGQETSSGKRTKEGLLYRGMRLEAATEEAQIELKQNLGVKTDLDLRGIGEGTENPLNMPNYYHFPSPIEYTYNTANTSGIEYYGEGSLVPSFGNAVKVLANKDNYPVYFHCSVGRDRTGLLGMVINFLCGVSKEDAFKDFTLSLFSTSGCLSKGSPVLYDRFINIVNFFNEFDGNNLSEKTEDYLVRHAGVTHAECENVRKIMTGEIDTGYVPGTANPDSYEDFAKVTFRKYGEQSIIKMVQKGSLLERPVITGSGEWYNGNTLWNFETDVVNDDLYLDYIENNKCHVTLHYTGINLPDETLEVTSGSELDLSSYEKEGYTLKVLTDTFAPITGPIVVTEDIRLNLVYTPSNGYAPKGKARIVIYAGQSNCAGVGHTDELEQAVPQEYLDEIAVGYENVLLTGFSHGITYDGFHRITIDHYNTTINGLKGRFGAELFMAERFAKAFPDETIYFVKYGFGSATLNYDFISPSSNYPAYFEPVQQGMPRGWLYDGMINSVRNTVNWIKENTNTNPVIEALMWMQGEGDSSLPESTTIYKDSFDNMVNDFKGNFPSYIGSQFGVYDAAISESTFWPHAIEINEAKRSRIDDHNFYIDTNARGLTTLFEPYGDVDAAHYDSTCYIDLGHMFADTYIRNIKPEYTTDSLVIQSDEEMTISMRQVGRKIPVKTLFNGEEVNAFVRYYTDKPSLLDVDRVNGTVTPLYKGKCLIRVSAYYEHEVHNVIIPVTIVD